jgi:integrase
MASGGRHQHRPTGEAGPSGPTRPKGKGEGSVYRRADGVWVAALTVQGRKHVRYARTQREAREHLRAMRVQAELGRLAAPSAMTLAEWVAAWLGMVEGERRPSTVRTYRQVLAPLVGRLGAVRLHRLAPAAILRALSELRREGMGSRRLQLAHAALRACLETAVRLGELPDNPVRRVPKPRHTPAERAVWSREETVRFVRVAAESRLRYAPLVLLLLGGGLRLSEALAVTWDDLDLRAGTVRITKALVWAGARAHAGPPKSRSGERQLTLPSWALAALERLPRPVQGGPLFRTAGGNPPGETALRWTMRRLCERAGVPTVRLHDLRHQHASLLLAEGLSVTETAARLGHASPSVTLTVYAHHVRRTGGDRAAQALELERLEGEGQGQGQGPRHPGKSQGQGRGGLAGPGTGALP